jgi:hypothetical protein
MANEEPTAGFAVGCTLWTKLGGSVYCVCLVIEQSSGGAAGKVTRFCGHVWLAVEIEAVSHFSKMNQCPGLVFWGAAPATSMWYRSNTAATQILGSSAQTY